MPPKFHKKKFINKGEPKEKQINENAKYLIIVESPSKCEKIESYLGSQYCCIASKGHIRTIDGIKAIDTKKIFEPKFLIIDEKKQHIEWMRTIVSRFKKENIILATDDDREGEAIAWHICEIFELPVETTKRIIFHEVTKSALIESIENPLIVNMNLVKAQHARQILDIIVGYKISPYLWKYLFNSKDNSLSAGRCQTPALRLVYDNEKDKNTNIETKYKTTATFFSKQIPYELNKELENSEKVLEFLERSPEFNYKLFIKDPIKSIRSSPKPFHTSRLLQTTSNVLNISPKETMELCQKLYQSGHITYMRTESSQYSLPFLKKAEEYINNKFGNKYLGKIEELQNKDSSNPHEAIRVTNIEMSVLESGEPRLISLYKLIWRNTVESCMSNAEYNNTKTIITAPMDLEYHHTIEIPLFLGWKKISEKPVDEEQNSGLSTIMYLKSLLQTSQKFSYQWIESMVVLRNKHQHYTEASLINKLEELGIGRPSTFASIIDTILTRGYVKKTNLEGSLVKCEEYKLIENKIEKRKIERIFGNEKNKLVIQPTGILTIEFLLKTFEKMFSYEYTKKMELDLDMISSGKESDWSKICSLCFEEIKTLSKEIKDLSKQVYKVDEDHDLIFAPFGAIVRRNFLDENNEKKSELLQVRKDITIDLEKAKEGFYNVLDILEIKNNYLGEHEEKPVYLKSGKFGNYIEWGDKKQSIKSIKKSTDEITLSDAINILSGSQTTLDKNILRKLDEYTSIKKGKYGPYAFYQKPNMKKPEFYNIKNFNQGFFNCEAEVLINWLKHTYGLK